jgi:hypothetical protein
MRTYTGRMVPLDAFKPEHACIEDIAFGLGGYRYGNAHPARVTIADHSVAVLQLVLAVVPNCSTEFARRALLHDAAEAYTQDLIGAVKLLIREEELANHYDPGSACDPPFSSSFDLLGDRIQAAIEKRFDCAPASAADRIIHRADKQACTYELALGGWCPGVTPAPLAVETLSAFPALYSPPIDSPVAGRCFSHWAVKLGVR